jgi:hypothetical protein
LIFEKLPAVEKPQVLRDLATTTATAHQSGARYHTHIEMNAAIHG